MRPTRLLLIALALWVGLALAAAFLPQLLALWTSFGVVLMAATAIEALLLWRLPLPECERTVTPALSLGEWHSVTLKLRHQSGLSLTVEVFDGYPVSCEPEGLPQRIRIPAVGWGEIMYRLRPRERGELVFGVTQALLTSPLGLLRRKVRLGAESETVRVFPNFRQVSKLAMLAVDNRTASMGIHLRRRRGEGTEFFQLRDYRDGDSLRQIDWKAVSRRQRLISREYREEQNQQVLFLLDCGRRLHTSDGDLTHFDHVLNAVLLLSYVALRQGDGVGVMTFSGSDRWLPPVRGGTAMNTVLNTVYDLKTSTAPSDFAEAASRLSARQKRRALVVVITNLRDDDSEDLRLALAPLRKRHMILVASLREAVLGQVLSEPIEAFQDALRVGAAQHYLMQRHRAHKRVRGQGLRVLDVEPGQLPVSLVNTYLEIKRAGSL
jgi:uncharacterized protein (DUF58 family)